MASSSSTPSSTVTLPKKYHVFLSFRGPDTRVGFTSHLNEALSRKYMVTFIDYKLERGDEISLALLKSIQESMIAVVIFSKDYASSKWCLRELAEIVRCNKLHELTVIPVFYYVNPTDVRWQTGPFEDSFAKHENESQEEVQEWRKAFTEASNRSGWDYAGTRVESELVRDIVKDVKRKLMREIENISPPLNDFEGRLIGIENRVEGVKSILCLDVRIIGIWGMGGIGKTTLAKAVFSRISGQFNGSCFIENVGERLENRELNRLLLEVLSKVLHEENLILATPTILHPFIVQRLNQKKVLIVFDDVNTFLQLETLVEVFNRCGLGSRMIVTSRDKQVLKCFVDDHDHIYEVEALDNDEALELFRKYAFEKKDPTEDLIVLSEVIVYYVKGNPLALKVLGSSLQGKSKQEWESALDNIQGIGGSKIFNVLKISYDGLNDEEKNLFLDIACFFDGYFEDDIVKLLDCKYSLSVLIDKSLITIEKGRIEMHDLLKKMGREIVRRESPKNPGKRSRLWKPDDVIRTLKNNNGTEEVEGISLDMDKLQGVHLNLSCQVFDKMPNLKFLLFTGAVLMFNKVHLPDCLNSLPENLIILQWHKYPLRALPSNFSLEKLVKLYISSSKIERLWEGTKHAPKLKWLFLIHCQHLTRIPNLSGFPSLENVDLLGCKSLVEFPSVQQLNKLRYLSLEGCSNVTKFPLTSASIGVLNLRDTAIEEVPSSIQSLTNLNKLDLSRCTRLKCISASIFKLKSLHTLNLDGCEKLETFPGISETIEILNSLESIGTAITKLNSSIEHLNELIVRGTAVGQLPSSIVCLENLEELNCSECRGLTILPPLSGLRSLSRLSLKKCNLIEIPEEIGCLSSLEWLDLHGNMFESLPKSIKHLSKLKTLSLRDCNMLRSLTELPVALQKLNAINCKQLCQALPDASEFKCCITCKYHMLCITRCGCAQHGKQLCQLCLPDYKDVKFLFINCFNLDQKAVSNVFEESIKGFEEPPTKFCIYLPGTEIPKWFTYQSLGSSINIRVLRQDLVNRKFMGFAICAVLGMEKYHNRFDTLAVGIYCHFETCDDHISFSRYFDLIDERVIINSDHILLGYSSFSKFLSSSQNLEILPDSECDYVDIPFEFNYKSRDFKVKYCAVHPIYAKPMKIIGATIEDIRETSERRGSRFDDNERDLNI